MTAPVCAVSVNSRRLTVRSRDTRKRRRLATVNRRIQRIQPAKPFHGTVASALRSRGLEVATEPLDRRSVRNGCFRSIAISRSREVDGTYGTYPKTSRALYLFLATSGNYRCFYVSAAAPCTVTSTSSVSSETRSPRLRSLTLSSSCVIPSVSRSSFTAAATVPMRGSYGRKVKFATSLSVPFLESLFPI